MNQWRGGFVKINVYGPGIAIAMAVAATPVCAVQLEGDLAQCSEIQSSTLRGECFDAVVAKHGLTSHSEAIPARGKWVVQTDGNKFTDQTDVYVSVAATEPVTVRGYKTVEPGFTIRCRNNTTAVTFDFGSLITTERASLRMRIGKRKPIIRTWRMSTNYESAGLWSGGEAIPFIRSLYGEPRLVIEVTPYGDSTHTVEFDIRGVEDSIEPVRKACGWNK